MLFSTKLSEGSRFIAGIGNDQNSQGVFWSRGYFQKIFFQGIYQNTTYPTYSRCLVYNKVRCFTKNGLFFICTILITNIFMGYFTNISKLRNSPYSRSLIDLSIQSNDCLCGSTPLMPTVMPSKEDRN